ncbi:homeobox protein Hox-D9b-like [Polymixia lowei]
MSLTNYYSMMETEDLYGAHFIPGGSRTTSANGAKPPAARGAEEETNGSNFSNVSNFSNGFKPTVFNGFSPWTNSSSSSSPPAAPPQLQSASSASLSGLFHPHHPLSHHHHHHHPYYQTQTQTQTQHLVPSAPADSRFVRCWEEQTSISTPLSQPQAGFPGCPSARGDLSDGSPPRYETIKPESSPRSRNSPGESDFVSPAEVAPERRGSVEESGGKTEPGDQQDPNNPSANWIHAKSTRKKRCPYTKHQTLELEKEFLYNMYLTRDRRLEVAAVLNLTERQLEPLHRLSSARTNMSVIDPLATRRQRGSILQKKNALSKRPASLSFCAFKESTKVQS